MKTAFHLLAAVGALAIAIPTCIFVLDSLGVSDSDLYGGTVGAIIGILGAIEMERRLK